MTTDDRFALWAAVNRYAQARGADMARTDTEIQLAVAKVERVVEQIERAARAWAAWADTGPRPCANCAQPTDRVDPYGNPLCSRACGDAFHARRCTVADLWGFRCVLHHGHEAEHRFGAFGPTP